MKRKILMMALVFIILCMHSGCNTKREIKSVTINETQYYPIYMYSFDEAEVSQEFQELFETPVEAPAEKGYVLSNESMAAYVEVWEQFMFSNRDGESTTVFASDLDKKATVVELEETYPITVKENKDTYLITYYTYSYSSDTQMNRLMENSLSKHTVEVVKENVMIEYY